MQKKHVKNFFKLLFEHSCLYFPPPLSHLPPSILLPFGFVHVSFLHVPWQPYPFFSLLSSYTHPSGYCQLVLYFSDMW